MELTRFTVVTGVTWICSENMLTTFTTHTVTWLRVSFQRHVLTLSCGLYSPCPRTILHSNYTQTNLGQSSGIITIIISLGSEIKQNPNKLTVVYRWSLPLYNVYGIAGADKFEINPI